MGICSGYSIPCLLMFTICSCLWTGYHSRKCLRWIRAGDKCNTEHTELQWSCSRYVMLVKFDGVNFPFWRQCEMGLCDSSECDPEKSEPTDPIMSSGCMYPRCSISSLWPGLPESPTCINISGWWGGLGIPWSKDDICWVQTKTPLVLSFESYAVCKLNLVFFKIMCYHGVVCSARARVCR